MATSLQYSPLQAAILSNQNRLDLFKCNSVSCSKLTQTQTNKALGEVSIRDTFTWNSLLQTQLNNGDIRQVTLIYERMLLFGVKPDKRTLPRVLAASRISGNLPLGKQLHCHVIKYGVSSDPYVASSLVELYGQLEDLDAAKRYFDTTSLDKTNVVVAWTLLAGIYMKNNKPEMAIDSFTEIISKGGMTVDHVALVTVITACGMLKSVRDGKRAHQIAKDFQFDSDVLVGNALVKMYIDCGNVKDAREAFDKILCKDVISWTAMIYGHVKKGEFNEGLKLFRLMIGDQIKADAFAVSSVLPACARLTGSKNGKEIHGYLLRNCINLNVVVQNALIDMYVKSGSIDYASRVFADLKQKDVISWTIMILGYSSHGQGKLGIQLYCQMVQNSTVQADQMTLAAVLYACYSAGLVEEGRHYFNSLKVPRISNFALMVSLLSRAGLYSEAKALISERNISKHGEVLRALLNGCIINQNLNMARQVLEQLCDLEPLKVDNHVQLLNWYAHHEDWEMVAKLRETISNLDMKPRKAYSWIELKNKVHAFGTGDVSHPMAGAIYRKLRGLLEKLEAKGFQMTQNFSLHEVDGERECDLISHSELLAISFGLIKVGGKKIIRVTKNVAVCHSCHSFVKAISQEVELEIVIRDPFCFHHFRDGFCSCRDCW